MKLSLQDRFLAKTSREERLAMAAVFAIALLLRLLWLVHALPDRDAVMDPDSALYLMIAENIMAGNGVSAAVPDPEHEGATILQPTAKRTPGYPLFCGTIMRCASLVTGRAFSEEYASVLFVQALLDSITALFVFLLARELTGWRAGLIAGIGYGVNYYVIESAAQIMTEALFTFVEVAVLLALFALHKDKTLSWPKMALAGALLGLAALIRPLVILFPLVAAGWLFVSQARWRLRQAMPIVVLLALFGAVLFPWAARNRLVFGKWIAGSTIGGYTFFYSSHAESKGNWVPLPLPEEARGLPEVELDEYFYRKGWEFVSANPGTGLLNAARKALRLYYVFYPRYDFFFGTIFLLAVPGVWFYYRRGGNNWWPPFLVLYTTLICAVYLGHPRYRIPLLPCFLIFMGYYLETFVWKPAQAAARRKHLVYLVVVLLLNTAVALSAETVRALVKSIVG
jgi:4-amino-4-deoxy-L-arabinose transferase-like glycosyltransferase